jgi:hypothetical protein
MTENEVMARGKTLVNYTISALSESRRLALFARDVDEVRCIDHALYLKKNGKVDGVLKYNP